MRAEPVGGDRFQVPEYDAPIGAYPDGIRRKEFEYGLYRLALDAELSHAGMDLDVGVLDDLNVVRFHARETRLEPEATYRWTTDQSFVVLNPVPAEPRTITLWMSSGGRPPEAAAPVVEVAIDDEPIGTAVPVDEVRPYALQIPSHLAARMAESPEPLRLRLRVATWNPAALLGVADGRDLGVMLTRVEVR
jgi:hypothetical protein